MGNYCPELIKLKVSSLAHCHFTINEGDAGDAAQNAAIQLIKNVR
jgi:hypothetical protein